MGGVKDQYLLKLIICLSNGCYIVESTAKHTKQKVSVFLCKCLDVSLRHSTYLPD